MKHFLFLLLAIATLSCQKKDINELRSELDKQKELVAQLQSTINTINTDVKSLQAITTALQNKISVVSYSATTTGYALIMSNGTTIDLKNGTNGANGSNGADAPRMGAKQDTDGIYYWTLGGEWLLQNGLKLRITGQNGTNGTNGTNGANGITPLLKVNMEGNYWMISYGGGANWQPVTDTTGNTIPATGATGTQGPQGPAGPAGIAGFSIVETDTAIFITYMGATYTLPKANTASSQDWTFAAGADFTLLLDGVGNLYTTGGNTDGQLGTGNNTNRNTPAFIMDGVKAIAAGRSHALVLKKDGRLYVTGKNTSGQLGTGSNTNTNTLTWVSNQVTAVAAGDAHSLFLKNDGTLYAMGNNSYGQLCIAGPVSSNSPLLVMNNVKRIAAGMTRSVIQKNDGTIHVSAYSIQEVHTFLDINGDGIPDPGTSITNVPQAPEPLNNILYQNKEIKSIGANSRLYFLAADGYIYSTSYQVYATQIILNGTEKFYKPMSSIGSEYNAKAIAVSEGHMLILKNEGGLYASGDNTRGQLGTGDNTNRDQLVPITANVTSIAAGSYHSMILKSDGKLYAAGFNSSGQLGIGNTSNKNSFTLIPEFD